MCVCVVCVVCVLTIKVSLNMTIPFSFKPNFEPDNFYQNQNRPAHKLIKSHAGRQLKPWGFSPLPPVLLLKFTNDNGDLQFHLQNLCKKEKHQNRTRKRQKKKMKRK